MQPVWLVRSRQIARKLNWWLILTGYDWRDRSLSNRIYLIYASVFWGVWFFAVFSLFAGPATSLLQALGMTPADQAAATLGTLVLLCWGLFQLWRAAYRSPFIFSDNDAHLICQTPVSRSSVAVAWLLGDWFEPALPFWAGAVTLSIALVDMGLEHQIGFADLPSYLTTGLQALLMVALIEYGMLALVWAAGALRLQRNRQPTWYPRIIRLFVLSAGLGLAYTLTSQGWGGLSQAFWQVLLWPIYFPLRAAFGAAPLAVGVLVGLAWVGLGVAVLTWSGAGLNLSRAAQETTQQERMQTAQRHGQSELARQMALTRRLGGGRPPSRLPFRPGEWMLGWKDILQSSRTFGLSDAGNWLILFTFCLGICLVPDPGARGLALAIWGVMAGQRVTARLQKDLSIWSLLRSLPFSSGRLLLADLALPWTIVVLLGWVSLGSAGVAWPSSVRLAAALLLPCLSAAVSLASSYDLLRQARPDMLLSGSTPQVSAAGGLLSVLCLALPLGLWLWLNQFELNGSLPAALLAALLGLLFWHLARRRLQQMD